MNKSIIDISINTPFELWSTRTIDDLLTVYKYENDKENIYYDKVLITFKNYIEWRKNNENYQYKLNNLINTYILISQSLILNNYVDYYKVYDTLHYTSIFDDIMGIIGNNFFVILIIFYLFFRVFSLIFKLTNCLMPKYNNQKYFEMQVPQYYYEYNQEPQENQKKYYYQEQKQQTSSNLKQQQSNPIPKVDEMIDIDLSSIGLDFDFNKLLSGDLLNNDFVNSYLENNQILKEMIDKIVDNKKSDSKADNEKPYCGSCANCNIKKKFD
jgi:hypothetical protein